MADEASPGTGDAVNAAAEAASVFPPFDTSTFPSQLLWLALSFGVLYYLMSKTIAPRIAGILEDRHDRIASDLAEAERLKRETDEAMAGYETALSEARSRAQTIANETRDKLSAETAHRREQSEAELATKLGEAETRIRELKDSALAEVDTIANDAAGALMEALAPSSVSADDIAKAVADAGKG